MELRDFYKKVTRLSKKEEVNEMRYGFLELSSKDKLKVEVKRLDNNEHLETINLKVFSVEEFVKKVEEINEGLP